MSSMRLHEAAKNGFWIGMVWCESGEREAGRTRLSVCETLGRERLSANKNEARALLGEGQSQVLRGPVQDGFNQSITEEALTVNMKRMGWRDDFELNGVRGDERGKRAAPRCFCAKKKRRQSRRLRSEPQTCSAMAGANSLRCPSKPCLLSVYSMRGEMSRKTMN